MAREYARIRLSIWEDNQHLDLSPAAQHLFYVLATDPGMSYCGRVDWRPARLSARARGWRPEQIVATAAELERARFVLFDPDTEEALVRSLIRTDELLRNPKMGISVVKAYGAMASRVLRAAVVTELQRVKKEHPEYTSWTSPLSGEQLARLVTLDGLESVGYTNRITNHIGDADQSVSPIRTQVDIGNADRSVSYPHTAYRIPHTANQQTNGGFVSGEPHQRAGEEPPPLHCSAHPNGTTEPCGPCGEARRAAKARTESARRAVVDAESERRRQAAADRGAAIDNCDLCDEHGYAGQVVCAHDPDEADRARRGMAKVRESWAESKREAS